MKKTAITYARKSIKVRGQENERDSVLYQLNRINRYVEENDYEIIDNFSDIGFSGVLKSRPELNRMLEFLKQRKERVTALILYNPDRLARDLSTSIELMLEITELVDEVIFVVSDLRSGVKHFRERFLIDAARYAEERRTLKERLRFARETIVADRHYYRSTHKPLGLIQKKKQKLVLGILNHTGDLEVHRDFKIVQCIFLGYLSKMSFRQIAKWITEQFGLTKRGAEWDHSSIRHILKNPVYAGMLSGVFMEGEEIGPVETIEPLVNLPLFQYVQMKLKNEKSGNKTKASKYLPDLALCFGCLLPLVHHSGLLSCQKCNQSIEVEVYLNLVKQEFTSVLKGYELNQTIDKMLEVKKQQVILRIYSLKEKLEALIQRENELHVELNINKERVNTLISLNKSEQSKIREKLILENAFYQFLFEFDMLEMNSFGKVEMQGLLTLPYLIMVNIQSKIINIKFHSAIFVGDEQHESLNLKMVNKDIRLLTDIG